MDNIIDYDISGYEFQIIPITNKKNKYKWLEWIGDYIYARILEKKFKELNFIPDILFSHLPRADRVAKFLQIKN